MIRTRSRCWRALAVASLVATTAGGCNSKSSSSSSAPKFAPVAKVTPACIKPGEEATVKISGAPSANIAVVPVYSIGFAIDKAPTPQGDADANGNFTTKWTVPTGAPSGEGKAKLAIAGKTGVRQVDAPFNVADASGNCKKSESTTTTSKSASTTTKSSPSTKPGETTVPGASTTAPAGGSTTSTTDIPVINGGDFKTTVTVTHSCVEPGGKQTLKVQTIENGIITYSVGYGDPRGGGNSNTGSADSRGAYQDTFVVPDKAGSRAAVQVVVAASGKRRSFAGTHFDVKDKC